MIKKILLSLAMFGFVFSSPILANAASFTSLKAQLLEISKKLESYNDTSVAQVSSTLQPTLEFYATPSNIGYGDKVVLSWVAKNTSGNCYGYSTGFGPYEVVSSWPSAGKLKSKSGSETLSLIRTDTFTINCFNIEKSVTVTVGPNLVPSVNILAHSNGINYGQDYKYLSWFTNNVSNCVATSDPVGKWSGNKSVNGGNDIIKNITQDVKLTLTCISNIDQKPISDSKTIKLIKKKIEIYLSNVSTYYGDGTTIYAVGWSVPGDKNLINCTASSNPGGYWSGNKVVGNGHSNVEKLGSLDKKIILTLTCNGPEGYEITTKSISIGPDLVIETIPDALTPVDSVGDSNSQSDTCSFKLNRSLRYGSLDTKTNKDVSLMQSVLVDEGLLSSKEATGKFYSVTQTALKKFQKKYGLSQNGTADEKTRTKLNELYKFYCSN